MNHTMQPLPACGSTTCPISIATLPYGYRPDQRVNAVFIIIFASSLIGNELLTFYMRRWVAFSIPMFFACLLEVIGYAVRAGSSAQPWDLQMFVVTTIFLTIAPSFVSTGVYLTAEKTFSIIGREHSLFDPKSYVYLVHLDILGLAIQLVGFCVSVSGISTTASLGPITDKGGYVVATGLALHFIGLIAFLVVFSAGLIRAAFTFREFGCRALDPETGYAVLSGRYRIFLGILLVSVVCLLIRGLYRIVGFSNGFDGGSRDEGRFALLDGLMVSEAVLGYVVFHPAYVFNKDNKTELEGSERTSLESRYRRQGLGHVVV